MKVYEEGAAQNAFMVRVLNTFLATDKHLNKSLSQRTGFPWKNSIELIIHALVATLFVGEVD